MSAEEGADMLTEIQRHIEQIAAANQATAEANERTAVIEAAAAENVATIRAEVERIRAYTYIHSGRAVGRQTRFFFFCGWNNK